MQIKDNSLRRLISDSLVKESVERLCDDYFEDGTYSTGFGKYVDGECTSQGVIEQILHDDEWTHLTQELAKRQERHEGKYLSAWLHERGLTQKQYTEQDWIRDKFNDENDLSNYVKYRLHITVLATGVIKVFAELYCEELQYLTTVSDFAMEVDYSKDLVVYNIVERLTTELENARKIKGY